MPAEVLKSVSLLSRIKVAEEAPEEAEIITARRRSSRFSGVSDASFTTGKQIHVHVPVHHEVVSKTQLGNLRRQQL